MKDEREREREGGGGRGRQYETFIVSNAHEGQCLSGWIRGTDSTSREAYTCTYLLHGLNFLGSIQSFGTCTLLVS